MLRIRHTSGPFSVGRRRNMAKASSWSTLADVLALYPEKDAGDPISYCPLGGGTSRNFLILTSRGWKVLKHYTHPDMLGITHEHAILAHMSKHRIPTPQLIPNRQHQTCSELDGRFYALYEFVEGDKFTDFVYLSRRDEHNMLCEAARTLARYHRTIDGFLPPGRRLNGFMPDGQNLWRDHRWHLRVLDECGERIKSSGKALTEADYYVLESIGRLKRDYATYGPLFEASHHRLHKLIVHSDYAPNNVLFEGGQVVAVLDFGSAHLDVRVHDVAWALQSFARLRMSKLRGPGIDTDRAKVFLSAYQGFFPMSIDELEMLPLVLKAKNLRHLVWPLRKYLAPGFSMDSFRRRIKFLDWLQCNEDALLQTLFSCP